ncbi:MAG: DUF3849 domain-containing protein, partial [Oscillospiraceae bacterium]|nr:DUF3849 domain-containing protein [Oscillospiraceae bacterium]
KFGSDCVLIVLAAIVVKNNYDGRYSSANKAWAETFDSAEIENVRHNTRYCTVKTHPVVLDGLVNNARLAAQEVIPPKTKLLGQLNDNLAKVKKVKAEQIKKPGQKKRKVTEVE